MLITLVNKFFLLDKEEMDIHFYELINNDINYLYGYTVSYEKYKLLSHIKKVLIPSNTREDWVLTPIDKWLLFLVYNEYHDSEINESYSDFFNKNNFMNYEYEIGQHDFSLVKESFDGLSKYLHKQKRDYSYFEQILGKTERLEETEKSILDYFMYKANKIPKVNQDDFFEKYFDEKNFVNPVCSELEKEKEANLLKVWMFYFAPLRIKLFSKTEHVKNISAYNKKNSFFNRKIEYNFFEIEKKIEILDREIGSVCSLVLESNLVKSKLFDRLIEKKAKF